jgi:DNA-binding MarR family transcriptional regulator
MAKAHSKEQLSQMALTTFALNGLFLKLADQLAAPAGITATRWQVLGAVLEVPLTQAEIARRMGITRQSVRRTCSQLVDDELVELVANPSHQKAQLVRPTDKGYGAVQKIAPSHTAFAERLEAALGAARMVQLCDALTELQSTLDELIPAEVTTGA